MVTFKTVTLFVRKVVPTLVFRNHIPFIPYAFTNYKNRAFILIHFYCIPAVFSNYLDNYWVGYTALKTPLNEVHVYLLSHYIFGSNSKL